MDRNALISARQMSADAGRERLSAGNTLSVCGVGSHDLHREAAAIPFKDVAVMSVGVTGSTVHGHSGIGRIDLVAVRSERTVTFGVMRSQQVRD